MMYYSNNYSKYIESLKAEKSKKAFQTLVESTKENKEEKISLQENYSEKTLTSAQSIENSTSEKERNKLAYNDVYLKGNNSKKIVNEGIYPNQNEYDAISTRVDIREPEKLKTNVSNVEFSSANSSQKINFEASETVKEGKEASEVVINEREDNGKELVFEKDSSDKNSSEINYENFATDKNGDNVLVKENATEKESNDITQKENASEKLRSNISKENIESEKKKKNLSVKNSESEKAEGNISQENKTSDKNNNGLIYDIIAEKKRSRALLENDAIDEKEGDGLDYLIAEPRKNEVTNLNRQYIYFNYHPVSSALLSGSIIHGLDTKEYEEMEYERNARNYSYYPAGSYSEINSKQAGAITDAFSTIANPSNWDNEGKTIVNSLKVATDVIDMINLVGPSRNIYNSNTANNLRWDLKLPNERLSEEKKEIEKASRVILNDNLPEDISETYNLANSDVSLKLIHENDVNIYDKLKEQAKDEDGNISDLKSGRESDDTDSINDKIKKQGDKDGDLTEDSSKTNTYIIRTPDSRDVENDIITNFAYIQSKDTASNRWFDESGVLGKIYVIPPYSQLAKTKFNIGATDENKVDVAFTIPLQNNLQFENISRAAAYTAISFFGRIGDVQQYSKTGSLDLINLTTKYFVEDEADGNFTMAKLQDIEMMYRSLVLPIEVSANYLNDDTEDSTYYYFTRPPLINIVLSPDRDEAEGKVPTLNSYDIGSKGVYKNLFTEVVSVYDPGAYNSVDERGNRTKSGAYTHEIFYKNFVVTNVSIDKNDNDYNYYVKDEKFYDKMGFTVTLTILEIDENYLNSLPSFNNYYNTIVSRKANGV